MQSILPNSSAKTPISQNHWHAVMAGYLGWTLDAFDFFVVVLLVDVLAAQFHVGKSAIILTLTVTLAMRPVGAVAFGLLADRFGRRTPLMINVIFFSVIELLCGFATNYPVFLALRALYGIGMGGEWGVGASLAMESAPPRWRGVLSGVLQSGYSMGYLLAAVAARFVLPNLGWRAMFWIGGLPALLALYIRFQVKESEAWKQHRLPNAGALLRAAFSQIKIFGYLVLLMTFMQFLSHGTQDLYPDFLKTSRSLGGRGIAAAMVSYVVVIYNVGAILGAICFGRLSDFLGRRRSIVAALLATLLAIPAWAFGKSLMVIFLGAFLVQGGVQGAWGVIPAHLNELAPDSLRGLIPGFAYQLGILFAAPVNTIEYALQGRIGYSWALAGFEILNISLLMVVVLLGREQCGKSFTRQGLNLQAQTTNADD